MDGRRMTHHRAVILRALIRGGKGVVEWEEGGMSLGYALNPES